MAEGASRNQDDIPKTHNIIEDIELMTYKMCLYIGKYYLYKLV